MKVGDIIVPIEGPATAWLRSGCEAYAFAICCSVEPFVMISEEGDMKWTCADRNNYRSNGSLTSKQCKAAFDRYERDTGVRPIIEGEPVLSPLDKEWAALSEDLEERESAQVRKGGLRPDPGRTALTQVRALKERVQRLERLLLDLKNGRS